MDKDVEKLQKKSLKDFRKKLPDIESNLLWEGNKNSIKDALDIFHYTGFEDGFNAGKEAAQPKWTLCKDAMPDKTVNCLCLDKDGCVSIDSYRENIHFMQDVIAWMPLPE